MRYEWDQAKDALNRRKHGLDLSDGISALEDPERETRIDDRFDYDEERVITTGRNLQSVLVVVSTEAISQENEDEIIRIISVRKATRKEAQWFRLGRA
jgi:hypothetical protein